MGISPLRQALLLAALAAGPDLKRAEVKYDPARVAPSELAAALSRSGFAATVRPK
jgi:hypothetical protein